MSQYLPKRDKCWKSKQTDAANHTVNMDDMQGSFFVLLLGLNRIFLIWNEGRGNWKLQIIDFCSSGFLSGSIAIGIEVLWKKYQRTKEENIIRPFVTWWTWMMNFQLQVEIILVWLEEKWCSFTAFSFIEEKRLHWLMKSEIPALQSLPM